MRATSITTISFTITAKRYDKGLNITYEMASEGNPTDDAANEATGVEPLNAAPNEPQTPQRPPSKDENIPASPTSLPPGCESVVFPLCLQSKTGTHQNISSLPHPRQFEELVKAKIRPAGPSRAEEMETAAWQDKYSDVLEKLRQAVDGGNIECKLGKIRRRGILSA